MSSTISLNTFLNALRNISPGLYNIYAAVAGETLGNRNRKMSVYENMYDRMIRGIGYKSITESIATDIQRISSHDREILTKQKQKAIDSWIQNKTSENLRRIKELGIKPDTVKKEIQRKNADKLQRLYLSETKQEKLQNKYLFDFAY